MTTRDFTAVAREILAEFAAVAEDLRATPRGYGPWRLLPQTPDLVEEATRHEAAQRRLSALVERAEAEVAARGWKHGAIAGLRTALDRHAFGAVGAHGVTREDVVRAPDDVVRYAARFDDEAAMLAASEEYFRLAEEND